MYITLNGDRLYLIIAYFFKHIVSRKTYRKAKPNEDISNDVEGVIPYLNVVSDSIVSLKDYRLAGIVEVHPVDFRMLDEFNQNEMIDGGFARVLNAVAVGQEVDIIKVERPLILDNFITDEMERIVKVSESREKDELSQQEFMTRVDVIQDRMTTIDELNSNELIQYSRYYLVFYNSSERELQSLLHRVVVSLQSSGIEARILNAKETAALIRYTLDSNFDERILSDAKDYRQFFVPNELRFGFTSTLQDGQTLTPFVINNYPLRVCNGWGEGLFDLPNTKVVMKLKPVEKFKAIRRIDNAILSGK